MFLSNDLLLEVSIVLLGGLHTHGLVAGIAVASAFGLGADGGIAVSARRGLGSRNCLGCDGSPTGTTVY